MTQHSCKAALAVLALSLSFFQFHTASAAWEDRGATLRCSTPNYQLSLDKQGFRISLQRPDGKPIDAAN